MTKAGRKTKAPKSPGPPAHTAAEALADTIRALAAEYDVQRAAILETDDPEPTHKSRVALRRLRAVVAGFAPILSERGLKKLQRHLRTAFRDLGPLRDADVRAAEFAESPSAALHAGEAAELREKLRTSLRADNGPTLSQHVDGVLADPKFWGTGGSARRLAQAPARILGQRALHGAWTALLAFGDDLGALSIDDRHEFRKQAKAMRYLSEAFLGESPKGTADGFLARMEELQESLGTLNDIAGLRAHAADAAAEGNPIDLPVDLDEREKKDGKRATKGWRKLQKEGPWWTD